MAKKKKKAPKAATASKGKAPKDSGAAMSAGASIFAPAALKLASSASKVVKFTCSSAICLVSIQLGLQKATFVSNGQMLLPSGFHQLTVQVQGPSGAPFTLTATGAQMQPLAGTASLAGLIPITV
jgi:hypothetical protein